MKSVLILFSTFTLAATMHAQTGNHFSIDGGLVISHFQQQVKQEVGDPRGERIVYEYELGIVISGRYFLADYFSAGVYVRTDFGKREAALFNGFDSEGRTVVSNELGGNYTEFWFGPAVSFHWKQLFTEFGYGLIGIRTDDGRPDIPSNSGDTSGSFTTNPSIAWLIAAGGTIPITDQLHLMLKLEYRLRYYDERGGNPLVNNIDHGTQSISPLIGISWNP